MKSQSSFYISKSKNDYAKKLIDSGEFETMTDFLRYSMRLFSDSIRMTEEPIVIHENRTDTVKISFRADEFVIDNILSTGLMEKSVIAEQSIGYYMAWRDRFLDKDP